METGVFLEDYVLAVGESLDLPCNAPDFLMSVMWQKDGDVVLPGNRTRLSHKVLHINNVSYDDSGVYTCRYEQGNTLLGNYTVRVTGQYTLYISRHRSVLLSFNHFFLSSSSLPLTPPCYMWYVGNQGSTLFCFSHNRPYSSCFSLQRPGWCVCRQWLPANQNSESHRGDEINLPNTLTGNHMFQHSGTRRQTHGYP